MEPSTDAYLDTTDLRRNPTLAVERAGALFGLGRTKAYEEARRYLDTEGREGIPTIRFGRTLRCPTAPVLRMLGLSVDDAEEAA